MGFKVKIKFKTKDVKELIESRVAKIEESIIETLGFIGEEFVKDAREKVNNPDYEQALSEIAFSRHGQRVEISEETPSFKDHTGNLRSSIGFVILKNGKVINQNFKISGKGSSGKEGMQKAKAMVARLMERVGIEYPKGFVLIVVAGMEYAAAVESKGYDVITGSSLIVEDKLKRVMKDLPNQISKMKYDMSINWEPI